MAEISVEVKGTGDDGQARVVRLHLDRDAAEELWALLSTALGGEGDRPADQCHGDFKIGPDGLCHRCRGEGDRPVEPCPNCGQPVRVEDSHACIVTREGS